MPTLHIDLLGSLTVALDDRPVRAFKYNKARALLAYMAVEARPEYPRAEICGVLWPALSESAARRNLSQVLSSFRALADAGETPPWLLADTDTLRANPALDWRVDVTRFLELLDQSDRHRHVGWHTCALCAGRLETALTLYRGDFLGTFNVGDSAPFEEWALLWRERLRQRVFGLLERLTQRAEWRGDFHTAAGLAERMTALDDLNEASQRERMRLLALDGQWAAAEAQFEQARRTLDRELGVAPSTETARLVALVRERARGALIRLEPPALRCPTPRAPLIGRADDLARITDRLRGGAVRVLTLTGAPGLGKTRLALEAALALRHDYADGVVFIDLAPLTDAAEVPGAVCAACGLAETGGRKPAEVARLRLRARHVLLVLDNVEHVLAAAGWVGDLLADCPNVFILATSRAPLRLQGEHQYELAPLPADHGVQLFVRQAAAVAPGFVAAPGEAEAIATICARVDGLPLAIELVAVHVRSLTPTALLHQLSARLPALESGARDAPERHRTLRDAIDWSYTLLDAAGRARFARLGVFAGGATLDAAAAVWGEPLALAALNALVDASLIRTVEVKGETRLTLLDTIREFAFERLADAAEVDLARERHSAYFLDLAEQIAAGPGWGDGHDRLARDHDNLRAALEWLAANRPLDLARMAYALRKFWEVRGHLTEGRRWLAVAAERLPAAETGWLARLLQAAALLADRQGDGATAQAHYTAALALYETLGDERAIAKVYNGLGNAALAQSDYAGTRSALDRARAGAERFQDLSGLGAALNGLGLLESELGNYAAAHDLHRQGIAAARAASDLVGVGYGLLNLSLVETQLGEHEEARRLLVESLAVFRGIQHKPGIALLLLNLGNATEHAGDSDAAEAQFRESLQLNRELGDDGTASYPMFGLGRLALARGDLNGARRLFIESLRLRHATGELRAIPRNLNGLGELDRRQGAPERAARWFGAAEALRETLGVPVLNTYLATHDNEVAALRVALGEARFVAAWKAGRAMTVDQAVALALDDHS